MNATLDQHITRSEEYTTPEQDEAYAAAMSRSMASDPSLGICECGRMAHAHSAYWPLCTICGFKQESITSRRPRAIKTAIATTALALILTSPAHAAPPTFELPLHPPDTYLAGCDIMVHDDGSRLAECPEDGAVLIYDVDGNRFVNEAGVPIRAAGWYVLE